MHRPITSLLLFFILSTITMAQPEHWGCHYFRNQAPQREALTDAQRQLINESIARSDTFNILHYDIAIDVTDYVGKVIKASTEITFIPLMAGQMTIRFDLLELTVDSITSASGPYSFTQNLTHLTVALSPVPALTDTVKFTVHYQGTPLRDPDWGGFYFESNYIYNLGIGLSTVPPNFGKVWYPCFDSFVERATYTYHVLSSGTYRAHCQGDFLGEVVLGGDSVIRSFTMTKEIPTHASAIAVADYRDSTFMHPGAYGPVPVTLTAKPTALNSMVSRMADVGGAIDALEYWYGQNPFNRVGYVLTTDGALEIPTNIAFPSFMTTQPMQNNRELLSHELGHHWWGDEVTPYSHEHMWLKEGPAEYSQFLAEEWIGGTADFVNMVKGNQMNILKNAHRNDDGFHPLSPMPDVHIYGTHTYYKGASVMHNMRAYLGDSLFRVGMHGVQQMLGGRTMTPEQFRDSMTTSTGYDMTNFFDDQVFQPGYAVFVMDDMQSTPNGNQWNVDLTIRQRLREALHLYQDVPLNVTLIGANLESSVHSTVVSGLLTSVTLLADFEPQLVIVDRNNTLNQSRLRHEVKMYPGLNTSTFQPFAEVLLYDDVLTDTTLLNMDHVWAGADDGALGWGVQQVSDSHYWIVNGIWPQGTEMRIRFPYDGNDPDDLDFLMLGQNEPDVMLVHRSTPQDAWEAYFDVTINYGNPNDGIGSITTTSLVQGEYALAVGQAQVSVADELDGIANDLLLFPNPAQEQLQVTGSVNEAVRAHLRIIDAQGKMVKKQSTRLKETFSISVDLEGMTVGSYTLQLISVDGVAIGSQRFVKSE